jgi:serine/threonine protein kinase
MQVIRRDLKSEKFLLATNGHVAVTDFGFSKYFHSEKKENLISTLFLG